MERFETMTIANVCTKELRKFEYKIFVIEAMLEEKPGTTKN